MTRTHPGRLTAVNGSRAVVREWTDATTWDAFVAAAPDSTVGHRWAWLDVVQATYGHATFGLAAVRDGGLTGVLPLVLMSSRVFGRRLVSMPYVDCAGICNAGDPAAETALFTAATNLAAELGVPLELRQRTARPYPLAVSTHKVAMTLDLTGGESTVWKQIKSNRRGQVRKAERNGLTTHVGGLELVDAFFGVLATNMRDLGSPVHRRSFFRNTVRDLGDDARILLVRRDDDVLGAALLLGHRDCLLMPFSSAQRSSFGLGTNQLLYWESIRLAIGQGYRTLDLGRSSPGSGTFEAKREWATTPVPLHWYGGAADAAGPSRGGRVAVSAWKHLPVPLATAGGHLVRGWLPQ